MLYEPSITIATSRRACDNSDESDVERITGIANAIASTISSNVRNSHKMKFSNRTRLDDRRCAAFKKRNVGNGVTTVLRRWNMCNSNGIAAAAMPHKKNVFVNSKDTKEPYVNE